MNDFTFTNDKLGTSLTMPWNLDSVRTIGTFDYTNRKDLYDKVKWQNDVFAMYISGKRELFLTYKEL